MDNELKELWGDRLEKVEGALSSLENSLVPTYLKKKLLLKEFSTAREKNVRFRYIGMAVCSAICGALIVVTTQVRTVQQIQPISEDEVSILAEAMDSDSAVSTLAFDLVPANDENSIQEEIL